MSFLVDANVLCEAMQARPDPRVLAWLYRHEAQLHVATLTLAEICKGIHLLAPGRKRRNLEDWFEELVLSFNGRVLPFDLHAATTWGAFHARHQLRGCVLPSFDSLLGAIALAHALTIVTRNTSDFPEEVSVLNPWE